MQDKTLNNGGIFENGGISKNSGIFYDECQEETSSGRRWLPGQSS
jgi:hypothetical protein